MKKKALKLPTLIGRKEAIRELRWALDSNSSEFLALSGRLGTGKTYFMAQCLQCLPQDRYVCFKLTGLHGRSYRDNLAEFGQQLGQAFYSGAALKAPENWGQAFEFLRRGIEFTPAGKTIVLFFDEFHRLVTRRSGLLQDLGYQWNQYWAFSEQKILLIVATSSTAWLTKKILRDRGGLHNRVTKRIHLYPFTLSETREYFCSRGAFLSERKVAEWHLVTGGVPAYLAHLVLTDNFAQNINCLFANKRSPFYTEYANLLADMDEQPEEYDNLLRELAQHPDGIRQSLLLNQPQIPAGGRSTARLNALEEDDFVKALLSKDREERGKVYKLLDAYTLLYLHRVEPVLKTQQKFRQGFWYGTSRSSDAAVAMALAFESLCYEHLWKIARKLGVGVGASACFWHPYLKQSDLPSMASIPFLFEEEATQTITLCHLRITEKPFVIDKAYAERLRQTMAVFQKKTRTAYECRLSLVTFSGIEPTQYSKEFIHQVLTIEDLF